MIQFVILVSRQGKIRLMKWYPPFDATNVHKDVREVANLVTARSAKQSAIIEWRDINVVYRRYASLFFIFGIDKSDNELLALEGIHHFVELLDKYFGNVCELDIIFNYHKAHYLLDEVIVGGCINETSKRQVLRVLAAQDQLMQDAEKQAG